MRRTIVCCVLSLVVACSSKFEPPAKTEPTKTEPASANLAATAADASIAAARFNGWLAAFNTGARTELSAFFDQHWPRPPEEVDDAVGFSQQTGGFLLHKIEASTATRFAAILQERDSDQFVRAVMDIDAAEPHRVTGFELRAIQAPDGLGPKRMTEADALTALRAELDKAVHKDAFSGAVVVAKNGTPVFSQAYGLADREHKTPNQLATRFRIGSMNKMFTATAILKLVQAKRLALDTPVGKVLTGYPNKNVATKVTVHHLLTHTGGTGDIFGSEFDAHRLELRTLQDYVKLYGAHDLTFEPGARWEYSNYGFLLLGAMIEKVTGKSYYDAVRTLVFEPAGMTSTSSPPEDKGEPGRSVGYSRQGADAAWTSIAGALPYRGTSAGGGDSTVSDLLKFANALTGRKLLDDEHTKLLITGKVDTGRGDKYAYGFSEGTTDGVHCFGHGGGAPGMNGELRVCESGYTIAVLANLDPPAASRLERFLRSRLPAK